jgi:membrane associated rhomboid family serine protease
MARARPTQYRCLACATPLREREVGEGTGIWIDQCPQCSGLFVDRDEFSRIKDYYGSRGSPSRPRAPAPVPREHRPPAGSDDDGSGTVLFQWMTGLPVESGMATKVFPWVTVGLLLINTVILIAAMVAGLEKWIDALAVVPAEITSGRRLWTLLTSMFMHAGPVHLAGNMYFLYVVGDNLEERLGRWKFLGFYLLCGFAADLAHIAVHSSSSIPSVGASGAIAGGMGAYLVLWPKARFLVRWFYFYVYHFKLYIPVWAYFGFWILFQFLCAALDVPGVGWWAHIGGFICGTGVALLMRHAPEPDPFKTA